MKRIIILFFAALFLATPAFAAEAKIGYIDLQKALNSSEAGKAAKERIGKTVQEYQGTVESRQKELKKLKDDLEKQTLVLSDEARAAKERDYQQKLKDYQRFTKDIQEELQQKDADYTRQILEDLLKVIKEIGQKEGYTVILEQTESSVLYADDKIDITEKVIGAYNAGSKKKSDK
ncbi:MAG: OmpH family outer membrane protein [Desulfuromonadales bacterium]|jgi:outer membrane protein